MSLYTVYWSRERVDMLKRFAWLGKSIPWLAGGPHTSQPRFSSAGVSEGDEVVAVTSRDGTLELIAQLTVRDVLGADAFVAASDEAALVQLREDHPKERGTCLFDLFKEQEPRRAPFLWTCTTEVLRPKASLVYGAPRRFPGHLLEQWRFTSKRTPSRPLKFVVDGVLTRPNSFQGIYRTTSETAEMVRDCLRSD